MAATDSVIITLQSKDWETFVGIAFNNGNPSIQNILWQLQDYYNSQATKPAGTTLVPINTTQQVVTQIASFLYGASLQYCDKDTGGSPFSRIMTALRALNTADNYISNSFVTFDTNVSTVQSSIRKAGRQYIMILQYDGQ